MSNFEEHYAKIPFKGVFWFKVTSLFIRRSEILFECPPLGIVCLFVCLVFPNLIITLLVSGFIVVSLPSTKEMFPCKILSLCFPCAASVFPVCTNNKKTKMNCLTTVMINVVWERLDFACRPIASQLRKIYLTAHKW